MRCLSCKYDLSHLTEHRCPECGRAFDPKNPRSFHTPPTRQQLIRRFLIISFWSYVASNLCSLVLLHLGNMPRPNLLEVLMVGAGLWPFIVAPPLLVAIWLHLRNR